MARASARANMMMYQVAIDCAKGLARWRRAWGVRNCARILLITPKFPTAASHKRIRRKGRGEDAKVPEGTFRVNSAPGLRDRPHRLLQRSRDRTQREAEQLLCQVGWGFRGIASLSFEQGQDALEASGGIVGAPRGIGALPELPVPTDQCPEFVAEFVARSCGEGAHGRGEADPQTDRPEATGQPEHTGH